MSPLVLAAAPFVDWIAQGALCVVGLGALGALVVASRGVLGPVDSPPVQPPADVKSSASASPFVAWTGVGDDVDAFFDFSDAA